jgi:hypothetical protein
MPAQSASPVQLQLCSASSDNVYSPPTFQQTTLSTVIDNSGRITYTGAPVTVRQDVKTLGAYASTRVFGTAQSVNRSPKRVNGVVYEFDVNDAKQQRIATFYGPRTGEFQPSANITPYGSGVLSPWNTALARYDIGSVTCFVAYVRFADGTSWTSPLARMDENNPGQK